MVLSVQMRKPKVRRTTPQVSFISRSWSNTQRLNVFLRVLPLRKISLSVTQYYIAQARALFGAESAFPRPDADMNWHFLPLCLENFGRHIVRSLSRCTASWQHVCMYGGQRPNGSSSLSFIPICSSKVTICVPFECHEKVKMWLFVISLPYLSVCSHDFSICF